MKVKLLLVFFLLNTFFIFPQTNLEKSASGKRIKILNPTHEQIHQLNQVGIDLRCGVYTHRDFIRMEVSDFDFNIIKSLGLNVEVEIDDITSYVSKRNAEDLPKAIIELEKSKHVKNNSKKLSGKSSTVSSITIDSYLQYYGENEVNWVTPSNFNLGSMGGCLTYSEVLAELDAMRAQYPNLISVRSDASTTGKKTYGFNNNSGTGDPDDPTNTSQWSGQTIYYVRISDNPDTDEGAEEPEIMYSSMIHSREVGALMNQMYYMWYLLENYATDPTIMNLVDNNEMYFIPVVNPDGLRWNERIEPSGGGMQRKNLRAQSGQPQNNSSFSTGGGVDINRNFDYFWGSAGSGSSGSYSSDSYRGSSAASEPETQIIVEFVNSRNFKTAVWQHTSGNTIPHPYGGNPLISTGREDEYHEWHEDMTRFNRYVYGSQILGAANGIADDWMLGGNNDSNGSSGCSQKIMATTPENGGGSGVGEYFWPTPSNIVPIAKRAMRINLMNAYYGGAYAKLHDFTPANITALTSNLNFGIERVGQTDNNYTLTLTPVSSNISSIATIATQTGFAKGEQKNVSAQIVLNGGISANDKVEYKVTLSNSNNVIYEANIVKYFQPTELFYHNGDNLTGWTQSGTWTTRTSGAWSGTSIKDGSVFPYATNRNKTITTSNSYDFADASKVIVQFNAKWDLERNYDFVEFLGSPDNGSTWYSMGGKYTKPASSYITNKAQGYSGANKDNNYSFQDVNSTDSKLIYDGDQMDKWVMEEIVIDASNNSELLNAINAIFMFRFRSDDDNAMENYNSTLDGFYFDDFRIVKIQEPCVLSIPTNVISSSVTATTATIGWDIIPSATYDFRYKEVSSGTWIEIIDASTVSHNLTGLVASTQYEYQVRSRCTSATSSYSSLKSFTTTAVNYCIANGVDASSEYISGVKIESTENTSGSTQYSDFTESITFPDLDKNFVGSYNLEITKKFNGGPWNEAVAVWIDLNKNGSFEGSEMIFDSPSSTSTVISTTFNVSGAMVGQTRMRVILKYFNSAGSSISDSCDPNIQYGEVEDYTVNIIDSTLGIEDEILSTFQLYPNPVNNGEIKLKIPREITDFNVTISNVMGQKVYGNGVSNNYEKAHTINTSSLKSGIYFVTVSTNLGKATKKLIIQE